MYNTVIRVSLPFTQCAFCIDLSGEKRKLDIKSLEEKYEALKDREKGLSNKDVTVKYGLNIKDFQASNGWLERWKIRNNIFFKTVAGEAKSCTPIMTASWNETSD